MSDVPQKLPPKKEVALALLEGSSLFVHLDPRKEGVLVPKWFMGQPQLVLQVGLNMAIPIPDLKVEEDGVTCTLSFNRAKFWCRLPWSAVYALVGEDGRGMVWPDDVPPEIPLQTQKQGGAAPKAVAKKAKPKLSAVDADGRAVKARGRSDRPREPDADADEAKPAGLSLAPDPKGAPSVGEAEMDQPAPSAARLSERPADDAAAPSEPPRKPKRELPPYLRVIK